MSHWSYLPFLLVWALPIVAIEWLAGARHLWRERRVWPWIVLALTAWFTLADAVAIAAGVWRFDAASLLGLYLGPVPVEEILFYLLTSMMVVQGYVLYHSGLARRPPRRARRPASAPSETSASPLSSSPRRRGTRRADSIPPSPLPPGGNPYPAPIGSADG